MNTLKLKDGTAVTMEDIQRMVLKEQRELLRIAFKGPDGGPLSKSEATLLAQSHIAHELNPALTGPELARWCMAEVRARRSVNHGGERAHKFQHLKRIREYSYEPTPPAPSLPEEIRKALAHLKPGKGIGITVKASQIDNARRAAYRFAKQQGWSVDTMVFSSSTGAHDRELVVQRAR